ncbi:MAG: J domain-containing protein [Hyphomicrobiaceae bacterium]
MGSVIPIFGMMGWLMWDEPEIHMRIGLASYAAGIGLAWYVPIWLTHRHVGAQNRLLDRCRALLLIATKAVEAGDRDSAEAILALIRRLEWLWWYGDAAAFRVALALWAIVWAVIACILIRLAGHIVLQVGWTGQVPPGNAMLQELGIAVAVSMCAPLHALIGYCEAWKNPWAIENCGDRLWQMLYGPRSIDLPRNPKAKRAPKFSNLTPQQIFGLGPDFTRHELDQARRKLALELHPDRWHNSSPQERHAREEALKRVNAANDVLRRQGK